MANPDTRVDVIRQRLAEIDPRFAVTPEPHPYAEQVSRGLDGVGELLEIAETGSKGEQLRALEALGTILAEHGIPDDGVALRIAAIGKRDETHQQVRAETTRALIRAGYEPFIEAFEGRLAADEPSLVAAAAHAMGIAKRTAVVPALVEVLAKSDWPETQRAAAWALGEIGDASGIEILEAAVKAEEGGPEAVEALGKLGGPEHLPLFTVRLRDADPAVRMVAAEGVARIIRRYHQGDHTALAPYLKTALVHEEDPLIGVVLISCMTRIGAEVPPPIIQHILGIDFGDASVKNALKKLLTPE